MLAGAISPLFDPERRGEREAPSSIGVVVDVEPFSGLVRGGKTSSQHCHDLTQRRWGIGVWFANPRHSPDSN